MLNVTTKYDKIGDERKRVFVIRGDEAYARTVDLDLTYTRGSGVDANNIHGFLVTFNATLYRNLGDSKLVFYDGEEIIDSVTTHEYDQTYSLNARLSWGKDHKIYAHYKSNKQTMGKKSKSFTLYEAIPSEYVPTITFTSSNQINENGSYTATGTVTFLGESLIGEDVDIYLDGDFVETVTTNSNGVFTCSVGSLSRNKHTITAEILQSEHMNGAKKEHTVNAGYNVIITDYSSRMMAGVSYPLKVSVKSYSGTAIPNATVVFNGANSTTNSQGIATFTVTNLDTGSYRASCNGSYSEYVKIEKYSPSAIQVTSDMRVMSFPYSLRIPIRVDGGKGLKINVYENNVSKGQITLDANGDGVYFYQTKGQGNVNVKFTGAGLTTTITVKDCLAQVSPPSIGDSTHNLKFTYSHGYALITNRKLTVGVWADGSVTFDSDYGKSSDWDGNVLEVKVNSVKMQDFGLYYGNVLMESFTDFSQGTYKFKYDNGIFQMSKDGSAISSHAVDVPTGSNFTWSIKKHSDSIQRLDIIFDELYIYGE